MNPQVKIAMLNRQAVGRQHQLLIGIPLKGPMRDA